MGQVAGIILGLAYILGVMLGDLYWGRYLLLGLGIILSVLLTIFVKQAIKKRRRKSQENNEVIDDLPPIISLITLPKWFWLMVGIIGFLASCYFQWRFPSPQADDISQLITQNPNYQERVLTVHGQVDSTPRLTRSQKVQFVLEAMHVDEIKGTEQGAMVNQPVTGKLYVTVPLLQGTGLHSGAIIAVTGRLYQPKSAQNPGSFDFKKYLVEQGIFAGFQGEQINWKEATSPPLFGWWKIRQQIVKTQVEGLGVPIGPLVSAISLGKQAVDLPYSIKDIFVLSGLAHAIAASGTQVSFLLGIILTLSKKLSQKIQFILGVTALIILLGLTGLEPSIVRASFMGLLTLIAIVTRREVKPLSALLLAAVVLLLINPLWIKDLGFQLSFLATLGLIVTVPPLMKYLEWLPLPIASLIAVPIAAFIWVTPRLIAVFGCLIPYSVITNIIASPLLMIISFGGFISAGFALVSPPLGSGVSSLLYYPTSALIELATWVSDLPGNQVNVGSISVLQEILLYSIIILVWILETWREWKRENIKQKIKKLEKTVQKNVKIKVKNQKEFPTLAVGVILGLIILVIPAWQKQMGTIKATILVNNKEPILVIQNYGKVILINSGDKESVRYTILPFLAREGINEISWGIATNTRLGISPGWSDIIEEFSLKNFYDIPTNKPAYLSTQPVWAKILQDYQINYHPLSPQSPLSLGEIEIQTLQEDPPLLKLKIKEQSWLLIGDTPPQIELLTEHSSLKNSLKNIDVLWWNGSQLIPQFLEIVNPKIAIISGYQIPPQTRDILEKKKTLIYITQKEGAIEWSSNQGFKSALESEESPISSP